jgi:hypothetical protein
MYQNRKLLQKLYTHILSKFISLRDASTKMIKILFVEIQFFIAVNIGSLMRQIYAKLYAMNNLFEEVLKPDTPCAGGDL